MTRRILALPGLLGADSVLREGPLARQLEQEGICRKVRLPASSLGCCASLLGLNPERHSLAAGPLAVAAWGWEPPADATQFRLDLFALDTEDKLAPTSPPTPEEDRWLRERLPRLGGGPWTVVAGGGLNWGLVWERGSLDMRTIRPDDALGRPFRQALPEGDGENRLRQLIEDSQHLFAEADWNRRRLGEGKPQISVAWPWGEGFRPTLPNIPLSIAAPLAVVGNGLEAHGLAKLTRSQFVQAANLWREPLFWPGTFPAVTMCLQGLEDAREHSQTDKVGWGWHKVANELLEPMLRARGQERTRLLLVATGQSPFGLAVQWDSHQSQGDGVPFDERALEEPRVVKGELWECVRNCLSAPPLLE